MLRNNIPVKRHVSILLASLLMCLMFSSCGSSRSGFRKKKDCGCGTWSQQVHKSETLYAGYSE
ncbi:MAG: hypothetical protein C0593_14645 [Marinilabiliales bacterium]|nr:MAG: hypothetical protein C0593_14645 [Marinilabiliales bacterium]